MYPNGIKQQWVYTFARDLKVNIFSFLKACLCSIWLKHHLMLTLWGLLVSWPELFRVWHHTLNCIDFFKEILVVQVSPNRWKINSHLYALKIIADIYFSFCVFIFFLPWFHVKPFYNLQLNTWDTKALLTHFCGIT